MDNFTIFQKEHGESGSAIISNMGMFVSNMMILPSIYKIYMILNFANALQSLLDFLPISIMFSNVDAMCN
jgi:hypothetical protein